VSAATRSAPFGWVVRYRLGGAIFRATERMSHH
jgi:hypothetical protein